MWRAFSLTLEADSSRCRVLTCSLVTVASVRRKASGFTAWDSSQAAIRRLSNYTRSMISRQVIRSSCCLLCSLLEFAELEWRAGRRGSLLIWHPRAQVGFSTGAFRYILTLLRAGYSRGLQGCPSSRSDKLSEKR